MAKEKVPSWVLPSETPPPPEPTFVDTLGDYANVATRAIAPYATVAALGAPFGPQGSAAGVTALGASDLITGAYNLAAPVFGGQRVPLPSETIQNQFTKMGVGRAPTTPAQQVFSDVIQAGVGGGGQALSARTLAPTMKSPAARNFMQFLGQNARGQIGASIGGAAAPSIAANYGDVTNPLALTALSLMGGVAGGKAATPKVAIPSSTQIKDQASQAYRDVEAAGVRISQPAVAGLGTDLRSRLSNVQYDPGTQPRVKKWLNILDNNFRGPVSLQKLDALRSDLMAEARTERNDRTRMMLTEMGHTIDDFIFNLKPTQTTAGNAQAATSSLTAARDLWRNKSQLSTLEDAVEVARNRALQNKAPLGETIRNEFRKILNNPRVFGRLSPDVQDAVRMVANGTVTSRGLDTLAKLSPTNRGAIATEALTGGSILALAQHPTAAVAVPATMATVGTVARPFANRLAVTQSRNALSVAAGNPRTPPIYRGPLAAPISQQLLQAPPRGEKAEKRRDTFNIPWWAIQK